MMPVQITAKKDGFRRAGVAHPTVMTEYADDAFTAEQLALLKAEPMLTVKIIKAAKKDNGSKQAAVVAETETQDTAAAVAAPAETASAESVTDSGA